MRNLHVAAIVFASSMSFTSAVFAQNSCPPGSLTCAPAPGPLNAPPPPVEPMAQPAPPPPPQHPMPQPQQYYAPQPAVVHARGGSMQRSHDVAPGDNVPAQRADREGIAIGIEALGAVDFSAKPVSPVGGAGLKLGYRAQDVVISVGVAGTYSQTSSTDRFQSDWTVSGSAYLQRTNPTSLRPYIGGALGFAVVQENAGLGAEASSAYNLLRLHVGYEWRMAPAVAMQFEARGQLLGAVDRDDVLNQGLPRSSAQLFGVVALVLYPAQ